MTDQIDTSSRIGLENADPTTQTVNYTNELLKLAQTQNDIGFEQLQSTADPKDLNKSFDLACAVAAQQVFELYDQVFPPEIHPNKEHPDEDPPNRMVELMQNVFYHPKSANVQELAAKLHPLLLTLRWLKIKQIELGIPKVVERLKKFASRYFDQTTRYVSVREVQSLVEAMLLSSTTVLSEDPPNLQFMTDVYSLTKIKYSADEYIDFTEYEDKVIDHLFHLNLLCSAVLAAQKLNRSSDTDIIDLETAFTLSPVLIEPLALQKNKTVSAIIFPEERNRPDPNKLPDDLRNILYPPTAVQQQTSPSLDIS